MDLYHAPKAPTVAPSANESSVGDLWNRTPSTMTYVFAYQRCNALPKSVSTISKDLTFVTLDSPALAGLERLRSFENWQGNWDAEGSAAPDVGALDAASKMFSLLAIYATPQVTLTPEGHPAFLYSGAVNGEVVVTSATTMEYFFADDDVFEQDVAITGDALPDALRSQLAKLSA